MKKALLFAALCVCLGTFASAQNSIHTYQMGPLKWGDFIHRDAFGETFCNLEYFMSVDFEEDQVDGISFIRPKAKAWTDYKLSWCDTNYRTPEVLRYNQCIFNLLEYYRRKLDKDLFQSNMYSTDQLVDQTMKQMADDVERIKYGTACGSDTAALANFERQIQDLLDSSISSSKPTITDAPFFMGFSLGGEFQGVAGQLHDHFSHGGGMYCDWYCGYGKSKFDFGLGIGLAKCLKDAYNIKDQTDDLFTNDLLNYLDLYVGYGIKVVDNAKTDIIPFVGYGLKGFYYSEDDENSIGSTNGCWHFGVEYNHKWSNSVSYYGVGDLYNCSHDVFTLNAKLFATYNNFTAISSIDPAINISSPKGFIINLQLGISWYGRFSKIH